MKKAGLFPSIITSLLLVSSGLAVAKTNAARQNLNNFFLKVNSLQGSFSQQVYSKKGKVIQISSGQLYLTRPGKFRWVYKTPDPQTIVADGKNIWVYDEDLEQVTIKPLSRTMSSAPISILTRKQSPDAQFVVKQMKTKSGGLDWFQLIPRKKSKDFKLLELGLDQKGLLKQMNLLDQLNQKTVVKLNARINTPINMSLFTFKVPKGVDVIGKPL